MAGRIRDEDIALVRERSPIEDVVGEYLQLRNAGVLRSDEVELARKEFGVLEALMAAAGATVSAEQLLERVWDEHTDPFTNVVRMTIMTLRRKLGDPPVVQTVIGVGYRLV